MNDLKWSAKKTQVMQYARVCKLRSAFYYCLILKSKTSTPVTLTSLFSSYPSIWKIRSKKSTRIQLWLFNRVRNRFFTMKLLNTFCRRFNSHWAFFGLLQSLVYNKYEWIYQSLASYKKIKWKFSCCFDFIYHNTQLMQTHILCSASFSPKSRMSLKMVVSVRYVNFQTTIHSVNVMAYKIYSYSRQNRVYIEHWIFNSNSFN